MAKALGKGLESLFPAMEISEEETIQEISIDEIRPNPYQPRKNFKDETIDELNNRFWNTGFCSP